ncbi:MAG TPA: Ig-like domain-containing protein [Anaerolineales bacterium]|nr:Ig-like domain-containing protein [Anaerolineales bacterium]
MSKNNFRWISLFVVGLTAWLLFAAPTALAQEDGLSLRLRRDFGYSSGTGRIQGTFSLRASGPEDLTRVEFFLDDQSLGVVQAPPFHLSFNTDNFAPGAHRMAAVGYLADGRELRSNTIEGYFISAADARTGTMRVVIPILVIAGIAVLVSAIIPMISMRRNPPAPGEPRKYGAAGGAICPRCGRPYSRNFLSPNMLVGKLERCPYCGKWAIVPAASPSVLRAAEEAERNAALASNQPAEGASEEKRQKDLDESRYMDL